MIYKIKDNLTLELTSEVLEEFKKYRQIGNRREVGGILLGQVFDTKIVIDEITGPSFLDKAGRFFFVRNVKRAQKIVNTVWVKSDGKRIYLGEWHTHPEMNPSPSYDDRKLIADMLTYSKMEIDFLFMIIVGLGKIDLYVGYQKGQLLNKLYLCTK